MTRNSQMEALREFVRVAFKAVSHVGAANYVERQSEAYCWIREAEMEFRAALSHEVGEPVAGWQTMDSAPRDETVQIVVEPTKIPTRPMTHDKKPPTASPRSSARTRRIRMIFCICLGNCRRGKSALILQKPRWRKRRPGVSI